MKMGLELDRGGNDLRLNFFVQKITDLDFVFLVRNNEMSQLYS